MHRTFRQAGARLLLLALAACAAFPIPATAAPASPEAVDRLAHLARLWGTVRYFHPYLAYRDLDWDAAAVAAIPRVRAARTREEYREAVAGMLAALGDPATRVETPEPPAPIPPAALKPPLSRWAEEGILILDFRAYSGYAIYQELPRALYPLLAEIAKARAVVFDLRGTPAPAEAESGVDYSSALDGLAGSLLRQSLRAPSRRYLVHSGYRSQDVSYGTYFSSFLTPFATAYTPESPATAPPAPRVVFLTGRHTVLPELALAFQAGGLGSIVSDGPLAPDAYVVTRPVDLGEGLTARVRTSETLPLPGWPGVHADAEVPQGGQGRDPALEMALRIARMPSPTPTPVATAAVPPLPDPVFHPDRTYEEKLAPELSYRLLAVFRFWNVIHYFYPYKALIGDWDAALPQLLARMEEAEGARGYAQAILEMTAHVPDGHVNAYGHPEIAKILGERRLPLEVRWIAGSYVVTAADESLRQAGVAVGDLLLAVDGEPVETRAARLKRFVTASTEASLRARIGALLTGGEPGSTAVLTLSGADAAKREVRVMRPARSTFYRPERPGPIVQILPGKTGDIGYVDLARLQVAEVDGMFERLAKTRAIVFDMRGYPHGTFLAIGPRLGKGGPLTAAQFRRSEVTPLAEWDMAETSFGFRQTLPASPKPRYEGLTVMLIDDRAASQSEHSGLVYEAANGTKFVGSPSAGANGDVTVTTLPGGIVVSFTGQEVRHADGRQLQRVGLQPDVLVEPTIAGIRAGRDEVLERAVRYVEDELRKK